MTNLKMISASQNLNFSACSFNIFCGLKGCQFPLLHQLGYLAGELNIGMDLNNFSQGYLFRYLHGSRIIVHNTKHKHMNNNPHLNCPRPM